MTTLTLSKKQKQSLVESNGRFNVWVGAVRSGKSFSSLLRFEGFCKDGPPGDFAIIGKSRDTIKRNVLYPMREMFGDRFKFWLGKGEAHIYDRVIHLIGANDERAEHKIRGVTLAGAYVDEMTVIPESVFQMLMSRLSVRGAQLFGTTNPDSPFHWLKTGFLDRAKDLDIKEWSFSLDDNPSLDEIFKANLRKEYQGLWYDRYILGKWVLAEGTIFDFFDRSKHVIDFPPGNADYYVVGVDYGTTNPTAFSLIGYSEKTFPNRWLEKEYYWDSKKTLRQKTDTEYAEDLKKFIKDYPKVRSIYIDPSAVSFRVELQRQGFRGIVEAQNEVLDGIRYHSMALSNGMFKICSNCTKTIEEYSTYRWDPKASVRGEDKPLKENDHCFVAGTMISTPFGDRPIESIQVNDLVFTSNGVRRVLANWESLYEKEVINVDGTWCTSNHKFHTKNRGLVEALDLMPSDTLCMINDLWKEKRSFGTVRRIIGIREASADQSECISRNIGTSCTGTYGNSISESHPKDCTYTTETEIPGTTLSIISNSYRLKITLPNISRRNEGWLPENTSIKSAPSQRNGIHRKREYDGIDSMVMTCGTQCLSNLLTVTNVENSFTSRSCITAQNFVPINVNQNGDEKPVWTILKKHVFFAVKYSEAIDTPTLPRVLRAAPQKCAGRKERVFNLTVEGEHEFFANGLLVANCMDSIRYAIYTEWFQKEGPRMRPEDVDRLRSDAYGEQESHGKFFDDRMW